MIAVKRRLVHEHLIYIALWAILFIAPLVSVYVRSTHDAKYVFQWDDVFMVWHIYLVYLVVFLIHNLFSLFTILRSLRCSSTSTGNCPILSGWPVCLPFSYAISARADLQATDLVREWK